MQNILYLMQKEFRQLFREKANLIIIFVMPFIQLVILGFAITMDVKNISTTVIDHDRTPASRRLIQSIDRSGFFKLKTSTDPFDQAIAALDRGQVKTVLFIPSHFERDLLLLRRPALPVLIDGIDGNSSGISLAYLSGILSLFQKEMVREVPGALENEDRQHRVEVRARMLYNLNLESVYNIVPGIIVILLTMITLFLSSINIVREKELGTLEQVLVTPIQRSELILGKILPFAIMGFLLFNVGILAAGMIFGIWMKGSLLTLYFLSLVFMLTTLGGGILISTLATTQQQAMFFSWFITIFGILMSGFFVPIENMPDWIQLMTYLDPLRYFMEIVRGIYLKGASFTDLLPEFYALVGIGILTLTVAITKFHKRIN